MNCLLDTHTFLWAAMDPEKLSRRARVTILDAANDIHVSVVTFWEVSLKFALGKMALQGTTPEELPDAASQMGFTLLALAPQDASTFYQLPRFQHKDPFDRILICQAIAGGMTILTPDSHISRYPVRVEW